ncbi:MAG TPA: hypothetical protein VHY09_10870 [Candidatus Methylacidiphilales bacterium]|nr:hypothetical protein [Candidatus Methylacidiphilales bacterium]
MVLLALAGYVEMNRHLFKIVERQQEITSKEIEKSQLESVISVFYAHYHKWPAPSGPLSDQVITELGGYSDASINTEHINFFKKMGYALPLSNNLLFKGDDASGTCLVYEQK